MNLKFCFILMLYAYTTYSQQVDSILHKAYGYNSSILLEEFFMNWEHDSKLTDEEKLQISERISSDDTLKEIYKLANTFYKPVYNNAKYFIIEDTLNYGVCYSDSLSTCLSIHSSLKRIFAIYPFRLELWDSRVLYLDAKYNKTFTDFFSSKVSDIKKMEKEYSNKKGLFDGYLYFENVRNNFGGSHSYHKEELIIPDLLNITINTKLDRALVTSGGSSSSNVTEWVKIEGKWKFVKVVSRSGQ